MADKMDSEETEIFLYIKQIQRLDKELERCQHEYDDLEKEDKDLESRCRMLEADEKDIPECRRYSLAANKTNVNKLTELLESQQQGTEQDSEALKLRHGQDTQELQERIDEVKGRLDELDSACMMQAAKLEEQKERLMQRLAFAKSLEKQMEEDKAALDGLIAEPELEALKVYTEEAHAIELATSNIVQKERVQHSEQSEQFHRLLNESFDMVLLRDNLQKQLENVSCEINKKKTAGREKVEHAIRCRKENNLKRFQQLEAMTKHYRTTQKHKVPKEENLRRDLASESEECRQKTAKASQLEADLQRERSKKRELEGVMWEGVTILRQIVTGSQKASDTHSKKQRLKEVLEILRAPLTSAEIPDLPKDPFFLLIRYRVGDLGFVSRPTWKCKPAFSTKTKLHPTRKFCSQKTPSSADPSPPAPQSSSLED